MSSIALLNPDQALGQILDNGTQIVGLQPTKGVHELYETLRFDLSWRFVLLADDLSPETQQTLEEQFPRLEVRPEPVGPIATVRTAFSDQDPDRVVYLSADRSRRAEAKKLGWFAFPHARLAQLWLAGQSVDFYRVVAPLSTLRALDALPYDLVPRDDTQYRFLGLLTEDAATQIEAENFEIESLEFSPSSQDLVSVQLSEGLPINLAQELDGKRVVWPETDRVFLALEGDEALTGPLAHLAPGGVIHHSPRPIPSPEPNLWDIIRHVLDEGPDFPVFHREPEIHTENHQGPVRSQITAMGIARDLERYSGEQPIRHGGMSIRSRHISHRDNPRAVDALVNDLAAFGLSPKKERLNSDGRPIHNVYADLPGRGVFGLPDNPLTPILDRLEAEAEGPAALRAVAHRFFGPRLPDGVEARPARLRQTLQRFLDLSPGGAETVLIVSHLDSTARLNSTEFAQSSHGAPGADDNASGMAANLAIARFLAQANLPLRHTVRFCFTNAEEQGLIGGYHHAGILREQNARIRAVYNLDMIGYAPRGPSSTFEIHSGHSERTIQQQSASLADRLILWSQHLGELATPQHYSGADHFLGRPDRTIWGPGTTRGDHFAFHDWGYPAVMVCGDLFENQSGEPHHSMNPNYHTSADRAAHLDTEYIARIARAVALAVIDFAR